MTTHTRNEIVEVSDGEFEAVVEQSKQPVLVDFWAPWCKPCLALNPIMKQLAADYSGRAKIVKVNTDEAIETAARFGVRGIPNVMLFINGEKRMNIMNAQPKGIYTKLLDGTLAEAGNADGNGDKSDQRNEVLRDNDIRMSFIASGELGELKEVLAENPQVGIEPFENGMTPIASVMRRSQMDRIEIILNCDPPLSIRELAGLGRNDELAALLEASPNLLNQEGVDDFTPLGLAVRHGRHETCQLLLEKGADPNLPKEVDSPKAPIVTAVLRNDAKMARLLINHGADVSVTARRGSSLLHMAALGYVSSNNPDRKLIELLLVSGLQKTVTDADGKVPFQQAQLFVERHLGGDKLSTVEKKVFETNLKNLESLLG